VQGRSERQDRQRLDRNGVSGVLAVFDECLGHGGDEDNRREGEQWEVTQGPDAGARDEDRYKDEEQEQEVAAPDQPALAFPERRQRGSQ
jgi:hypothetical protein